MSYAKWILLAVSMVAIVWPLLVKKNDETE